MIKKLIDKIVPDLPRVVGSTPPRRKLVGTLVEAEKIYNERWNAHHTWPFREVIWKIIRSDTIRAWKIREAIKRRDAFTVASCVEDWTWCCN